MPEADQIRRKGRLRTEDLAGWYLRLNGFLTMPNFIVHRDEGYGQRTEADILAVRFPYREEVVCEFGDDGVARESAMADDRIFVELTRKPCILITEVKATTCSLNDRLIDPAEHNLERVLRVIGILPRDQIAAASAAVYRNGFVDYQEVYIGFCCVGERINRHLGNPRLKCRYDPARVPQITFEQISEFIYGRFDAFTNQKRYHHQWGCVGRLLWDLFYKAGTKDSYVNAIRAHLVPE